MFACPYCQALLNPREMKPGRFQPTCPKCRQVFVVFVPDDPTGTIFVQQLNTGKAAAKTPGGSAPVLPQVKSPANIPASPTPPASRALGDTPAAPPRRTASPQAKPPSKPVLKPVRRKLSAEEYAALLFEGKDPADYGDPPDSEPETPPQPLAEAVEVDPNTTTVRPPESKPPVGPPPGAPKDKTAPKSAAKMPAASAPKKTPGINTPSSPRLTPQADPNATGDFTEANDSRPIAKKSTPFEQQTVSRQPTDPNATGDFTEPAEAFAEEVDANATGDFTEGDGAAETETPGDATERSADFHNKGTRRDPNEPAAEKPKSAKKKTRKETSGDDRVLGADVPPKLGGFEVLKVLGRGGMGAVLLGRQISLDRKVALKVMHPHLSQNPSLVARFTREAYAAAQLTHHNVIQIYDIGEDKGQHFFSMEFVQGQSLMDVVKKEGKLPADVAVGYILQAARGLRYGHNQGMVHRDIKPDNLMLNTEGIVKVADLGLVKLGNAELGSRNSELKTQNEDTEIMDEESSSVPSSALRNPHLTRAGAVMGTPAYMSPEQSTDSAAVDARADIYSLGCTLYVLITGKPPFDGKTALEIISKHQTEPIVPPEVVVKRVPPALSALLLKMLAKKPADRYQSMDEVIAALEGFLGLEHTGSFNPKEEQADLVEKCSHQFQFRSKAGLKRTLALGFFALCVFGIVGAAFAGMASLAGGIFGLALMTPIAYFIIHGIISGSVVFSRLRGVVFGMRFIDWLFWGSGSLLFLITLFLFGFLWSWLGFAVLAVGLAFVFWFLTDRAAAKAQEAAIDEARGLLRTLRLQGLPEDTIRQFVCKFAGQHWEQLYESLFGYEAMLAARASRKGDTGETWKKHGTWRDPVVLWADARMESRRLAKERSHLQKVEVKALEAEGVSKSEAKAQAEEMAAQMVDQAEEAKKARKAGREVSVRDLVEAARERRRPKPGMTIAGKKHRSLWLKDFVDNWFGRRLRLVLGAVVFAAGLLWLNQNNLLQGNRAFTAITEGNIEGAQQAATAQGKLKTTPLSIATNVLPKELHPAFNTWALPITGLLLLINGVFYFGWRPTLATVPGAAVALFGPLFGIPEIGPLTAQQLGLVLGAVLILVVARFLRQ